MSELSKSQAEELIPTRELFGATIPLVSIDAELKGTSGDELHQLGENRLANIHRLHPNCVGKLSLRGGGTENLKSKNLINPLYPHI